MDACLDVWINGIYRHDMEMFSALLAFGYRWIPLTKGQEHWRWLLPKQSVEQTVKLSNRWFETSMWSTLM